MTIGKFRRALYQLNSWLGFFNALMRGPKAVLRYFARRHAAKAVWRGMRKAGL